MNRVVKRFEIWHIYGEEAPLLSCQFFKLSSNFCIYIILFLVKHICVCQYAQNTTFIKIYSLQNYMKYSIPQCNVLGLNFHFQCFNNSNFYHYLDSYFTQNIIKHFGFQDDNWIKLSTCSQ